MKTLNHLKWFFVRFFILKIFNSTIYWGGERSKNYFIAVKKWLLSYRSHTKNALSKIFLDFLKNKSKVQKLVNLLSLLTSSSDANLSEYLKKCHTANGETSNWALRENDLFLLHLHSLMECFILPLSFSPSHSFFSPLKMSQMHIKSIFHLSAPISRAVSFWSWNID